jgi:beta-lactamase regulating signal transducer with metallopeptidase domain
MTAAIGPVVSWLAEVYLLATVVLAVAGAAVLASRQPARRLAAARAALVALAILAPLDAAATGRARPAHAHSQVTPGGALESVSGTDVLCCPPASAAQGRGAVLPASPSAPVAQTPDPADRRLGAALAAFAAGSVAMTTWLVLGAFASARLLGRARPSPGRLRAVLERVVGGSGRVPRLLVSSEVGQPVAVGLFRPAIILPARFAEDEPEQRLEAALAHEWAHVRNGDLRLLALSRLLLPLLFAHPLYAWLRLRVRADQEALADAAAASGAGPIAYAEALLDWARPGENRVRRSLAPSLGLWERPSQLGRRIALLLHPDFPTETACPRRWRLGVAVVTCALVLGLGASVTSGTQPPSSAEGCPACANPAPPVVTSFLCPPEAVNVATGARGG